MKGENNKHSNHPLGCPILLWDTSSCSSLGQSIETGKAENIENFLVGEAFIYEGKAGPFAGLLRDSCYSKSGLTLHLYFKRGLYLHNYESLFGCLQILE